MILLHVTYTMKPGQKENYLAAIAEAGIDKASREEVGNICYDYFYAAQKEDTILLIEQWDNEDVLELHKTMPHFKQLAAIKDQYVEQTMVKKYILALGDRLGC